MQFLVGDVGGTKSALGLAETGGDEIRLSQFRRYPSSEFSSLDAIVRRYLDETQTDCEAAAFAVAGPVHGRRSQPTNLPWALDADDLESSLGLSAVHLLNDLEALAWGIEALGEQDVLELHAGEGERVGNLCVVAAGTGLGEAGLYWDGQRHHPFATEGGHADFAPADDTEIALLVDLRRRYGRVSWERLVSGMGILNIHEALLRQRAAVPPDWLQEAIARGEAPAAIARSAAEERCELCATTMALFFRLYGREAGNLALKQMALGGVYLGGGIAPANLDALQRSDFLESFFHKGRMEALMRRMPVRVILQPQAPLLGAARYLLDRCV